MVALRVGGGSWLHAHKGQISGSRPSPAGAWPVLGMSAHAELCFRAPALPPPTPGLPLFLSALLLVTLLPPPRACLCCRPRGDPAHCTRIFGAPGAAGKKTEEGGQSVRGQSVKEYVPRGHPDARGAALCSKGSGRRGGGRWEREARAAPRLALGAQLLVKRVRSESPRRAHGRVRARDGHTLPLVWWPAGRGPGTHGRVAAAEKVDMRFTHLCEAGQRGAGREGSPRVGPGSPRTAPQPAGEPRGGRARASRPGLGPRRGG